MVGRFDGARKHCDERVSQCVYSVLAIGILTINVTCLVFVKDDGSTVTRETPKKAIFSCCCMIHFSKQVNFSEGDRTIWGDGNCKPTLPLLCLLVLVGS